MVDPVRVWCGCCRARADAEPHMNRKPRPTSGLSVGERRIFWRVRAACCDTCSIEIDLDEYCRHIARTVVQRQKAMAA